MTQGLLVGKLLVGGPGVTVIIVIIVILILMIVILRVIVTVIVVRIVIIVIRAPLAVSAWQHASCI